MNNYVAKRVPIKERSLWIICLPTVSFICLLVINLFFSVPVLSAQPFSVDPLIPDGEKITYMMTSDDKTYPLVQWTLHKETDTTPLYEIRTESETEDMVIRINRENMTIVYHLTIKKGPDYRVENETMVVKNSTVNNEDTILLMSFSGINHILRGFPFEKPRVFKIRSIDSGGLTMYVKLKKKTTVETKIGDIPCYMLEFGVTGFLGKLLPKTYFWYSVEPPHYCVLFKGQPGPPGSPSTTIELLEYEAAFRTGESRGAQ